MTHEVAIRRGHRNSSSVATGFKSIAGLLVLSLALASSASATQVLRPKEMVGKVQHRGFLSERVATAWCVSAECDVVLTNYHVTKILGPHATVNGVSIADIASATGEQDRDARVMPTVAGPLKLAYGRDISLLTMEQPLARRGMHPVPFYLGRLQPGQKITAIGYPGGKLQSISGQFVEECGEGVLKFNMTYETAEGFSGGLVVDEQGRAVGMVFLGGLDRHSAYAVPVWALADFIRTAKPQLYAALFNGQLYRGEQNREDSQNETYEPVADDAADNIPGSVHDGFSPAPVLPESYLLLNEPLPNTTVERYNVSSAVLALRHSAQLMSQQMKNFVARQTLLLSNGRAWQHELQLVGGRQRFRTMDGRKELDDLPIQGGPVPGSEWSKLVGTIGSNPLFAVQFEREITVENHTVKVFRYQVRSEDQICQLRVARTFHKTWKESIPCTGAVWTDERFNILRITQDMTPPEATGLAGFRIVILYGWWGQKLVPVEMYLRSVTTDGKSYASRGKFDGYRAFSASSKIVLAKQNRFQEQVLSLPSQGGDQP